MDKEFFMNASMPPPLQFDHPFSSAMNTTWQTLSTAMEIQPSQCNDTFLSPPPSTTTADHFESALSSMVSSPNASGSSNDNFMIRELIGKLGNICNSGDIPTSAPPGLPPYIGGGGGGGGSCSTNNSCYSTPLNSPPKVAGRPIMDPLMKENFPNLGNSIPLGSNLPAMPGDPGFAERAARFSSFGSRSFNGRTSQFVANNNNPDYQYRSNSSNLGGSGKLHRVSSSPSLKEAGPQAENIRNSLGNSINERRNTGTSVPDQGEFCSSLENSSASGQNTPNRKRKAAPKGKTKENQAPIKEDENGDDSSAKRTKSEDGSGKEDAKTEENRGDESKKQSNSNQKPPEAPKDYIHVRARRGQATDSHSLAERVRREKISERMKLLQDLVPGCNKVTGKALMLDEIINYVQSLQRQVEFLSMKLASVNPRLELNMDNLFSKDAVQPNCSMPHPMYPIDSLAPTLYGQHHQNPLTTTTSGPPSSMAPSHMDPLNPNHALQLPPIDGFSNAAPQLSSVCEGDLQSIVQMGYGQKETGFQSQPLLGKAIKVR